MWAFSSLKQEWTLERMKAPHAVQLHVNTFCHKISCSATALRPVPETCSTLTHVRTSAVAVVRSAHNTPPTLHTDNCFWLFRGGGWLVSLQWKKMANITLTMWTKLAPSVISHVESRYPWYSVMIKSFKLCSLPPTNMRQLQVEEDSTKCLTNTLKTVKDMKNKDSLRHYYNKDIGQLYIMWYLEWDLKTEEGN